jgi:hypothetical protein
MHDVIEKDGNMSLAREARMWVWAHVDAALNLPSFISQAGYAIFNPVSQATHRVIIRAASGVEATTAAWVYEKRLRSSPRWYKVLGWTESDMWLLLNTHLMERSDQAQPPLNDLRPEPSKVLL